MTEKLRRFSLTAYQAPLCETIVDCPEPQGTEVLVRIERCGVCHSDLHMQDGFFALGDGKTLDVREGRNASVHARSRDRRRCRARGPRRHRHARRESRGLSVDRLRPMRRLQGRRGEPLQHQPPSRHLGRRRLCHARAGAAPALPDRLRTAAAGLRRRADVLRADRLFGAQAIAGPCGARAGASGRSRRCRHDGAEHRQGVVSARPAGRRHRRRQARGRA